MNTIEFKPRTTKPNVQSEGSTINKISIFTNEDREVRKELVEACEEYFRTKNSHLTIQQQKEFWYMCRVFNLNPIKGEVYAVPFNGQIQIVVGYQMYAQWAKETGKYDYCDFEVQFDDKGIPTTGKAIVKRTDQTKEMTMQFLFKEWNQERSPIWKAKPLFMFQKVMYSIAMRWAFPEILSSKPYTQAELWYRNEEVEDKLMKAAELEEGSKNEY